MNSLHHLTAGIISFSHLMAFLGKGVTMFSSAYQWNGMGKPHNLSGTINSKDDELAFTISRTDNSSAFYTSRPKSGKGRTQLFLVKSGPD